jgi:hypothetical protein
MIAVALQRAGNGTAWPQRWKLAGMEFRSICEFFFV